MIGIEDILRDLSLEPSKKNLLRCFKAAARAGLLPTKREAAYIIRRADSWEEWSGGRARNGVWVRPGKGKRYGTLSSAKAAVNQLAAARDYRDEPYEWSCTAIEVVQDIVIELGAEVHYSKGGET